MLYSSIYESPIGNLTLICDEESIVALSFEKERYLEGLVARAVPVSLAVAGSEGEAAERALAVISCAKAWLRSYFAGEAPSTDGLPLAPVGSEFRQCVWKILLEIPYGKTLTYGDVAKEVMKRMNKERMSAQAVGGAVGHNPIGIIIPCHRVVGTNGSLTGFGGGIEVKVKLLEHEGTDMTGMFIPTKGTAL